MSIIIVCVTRQKCFIKLRDEASRIECSTEIIKHIQLLVLLANGFNGFHQMPRLENANGFTNYDLDIWMILPQSFNVAYTNHIIEITMYYFRDICRDFNISRPDAFIARLFNFMKYRALFDPTKTPQELYFII
jgi:hypothetical protein